MNRHYTTFDLLARQSGTRLERMVAMPPAGSPREYYRLHLEDKRVVVGVFNPDKKENLSYYHFTRHFKSAGLNVPDIYAASEDYHYFLLQDLGNETLMSFLERNRETLSENEITNLFEKAVDDLLRFQMEGLNSFPFQYAYPVKAFNKRAVLYDLNYFKYAFIKANNIVFNEEQLQDDFEALAKTLLESGNDYFQYRDFQSRNIMIHDNRYWYIDFQGGRKGPLQYDLVSLIYQAKAKLKQRQRDELYRYYLKKLGKINSEAVVSFKKNFSDFVFFRLIQILGAYGFRGLLQRKTHFLESIYPALETLEEQLGTKRFSVHLPELTALLEQSVLLKEAFRGTPSKQGKLLVEINSFSYKKCGIPYDISPNGGGFVFDCRALPNPGRILELSDYTGKDEKIIRFFEGFEEIARFKQNVFNLVDQSVEKYLSRRFTKLQVNFGCTGGKHRSVYMAESLKKHLEGHPGVVVTVHHKEHPEI